ncbi:MAG TPA: M3 family metallopeptidase [Vicinamibacterales bacterium]|nr:M3 family metallopeptidase [Vicinamibacterales bacterium]
MRFLRLLALAVLVSSVTTNARQPAGDATSNAPFFAGVTDPASLTAAVDARLARARARLDAILAVTGARTVANTLRPYDDIRIELGGASGLAGIVNSLHPDAVMRKTAEGLNQRASAFATEIGLDRVLYDALAAIDISRADDETRHYVERILREYRRDGVEKDAATRQRIKELRDESVRIAQEFSRNVRSGVRRLQVDPADLDGLPADFIAAKKPDANGKITLTTEATDQQPVMLYANSDDLRRRMVIEANNVAYPENVPVIERMIATRAELARILNNSHWADYDIADRMAATAKNAGDFIDRVIAASTPKATREMALLLERKRQDFPNATTINAWERRYYTEVLRRTNYAFDSQTVRPYLPYDRVRDGVLAISTRLFGFEFRRAPALPVWHPSVEPYEVFEGGQLVGRVYLDMHPRADKGGGGASASTVRAGVGQRQIPEVVLTARVSGGQAGDPGLMVHDQVVTFFHEFGHVLHALSSGRLNYIGLSRIAERDFGEAPSQMLEEWAWDPATLATFARHYQTGEAIPARLVQQMRRAGELGKASDIRQQMLYAKMSLSLHDRDPKLINVLNFDRDMTGKYSPMPYVEDTHITTAFTHLINSNYTAAYYTYMWSLVIAKDLYSQFDPDNLLDAKMARRYRDLILAPAGSKPAATLVADFLGRPFDFKAWEAWLNYETP